MNFFDELLGKIRTKRKAKFASVAQEYDAAIFAIATGAEVDADHMTEMLDALDKSDSDLEKDIKDKRRRVETVSEIVRLKGVEKELRKSEQELQRLRDEVARFVAERQPKIEALAEQAKYQQLDFDRLSTLQDDLLRVGVPFHLQQKRQELTARRRAWAEKEREYSGQIDRPKTLARQEAMRIEVIDQKLSRCDISERELLEQSRQKSETERQRYQAIIDGLSSDKAALDAELREIEKEERELNAELLKP